MNWELIITVWVIIFLWIFLAVLCAMFMTNKTSTKKRKRLALGIGLLFPIWLPVLFPIFILASPVLVIWEFLKEESDEGFDNADGVKRQK